MTISVARLIRCTAALLLCGIAGSLTHTLYAQQDKELIRLDRRLNNLIRSIDDIIWSDITIYKLEDEYRSRLIRSMENEDKADIEAIERIGEIVYDEPLPDFYSTAKSLASSVRGKPYQRFKTSLALQYGIEEDFIDDVELQNAYNMVLSLVSRQNSRPKEFYLVASRDLDNPRLMALLGVKVDVGTGKPVINKAWAGTELYDYLSSNGPDSTMYSELKGAIRDKSGSISNQMFALRDLNEIALAPKTKARATYISESEYPFVLKSISMGRPVREEYSAPAADSSSGDAGGLDMFGNMDLFEQNKGGDDLIAGAAVPGAVEHANELVVGTDVLVGYYSYELKDNQIPDPKWGVEVLNNFDEINYPSIWGGRLTVNALLENVKIGAVLPQPRFGGNTVDSSGIGSQPQRILGGYGIAFSGDFDAPILDNSGLFNFHASYTFGEAETDAMLPRQVERTMFQDNTFEDNVTSEGERLYLIRFAFQSYYSFGLYADNDAHHLFRMKLGGTVYGVDEYSRDVLTVLNSDLPVEGEPMLTKNSSKTIGGLSAKIEYMKGGTNIPYGVGIQYFDESLLSNLWIQFVVARNLDLKLEGKFFTALRDPQPWENNSLIVPSLALKYHFGAP